MYVTVRFLDGILVFFLLTSFFLSFSFFYFSSYGFHPKDKNALHSKATARLF